MPYYLACEICGQEIEADDDFELCDYCGRALCVNDANRGRLWSGEAICPTHQTYDLSHHQHRDEWA